MTTHPLCRVPYVSDFPFDDFLKEERIEEIQAPVYLSGSLVEGFGNTGSDIDIFVISNVRPKGDLLIEKAQFSISIGFHENRRVDFEYWSPEHVTKIAEKLAKIKPGIDFVAEKLLPIEELFIHRLSIGIPLRNSEQFDALKAQFDFSLFSAYLTQQSVHRIDGAIEDLAGMFAVNDLEVALLRAYDLAGLIIDAYTAFKGQRNSLPKWRVKKLENIRKSTPPALFEELYLSLFPNWNTIRKNDQSKTAYIEQCVKLSHTIVELIQETEYGSTQQN